MEERSALNRLDAGSSPALVSFLRDSSAVERSARHRVDVGSIPTPEGSFLN